jgi:hypothetical protein
MSSLIDFQREVKKALELERVRDYVEQQGTNPAFWEWLNSAHIPILLFFAISKHLNQNEEVTHLAAHRRHLVWQYRIALECDKEERRSPVLTKMQEIGLQAAYNPPPEDLVEATARDMLENSKLTELGFESQQAVYLYNFLAAAEFPTLATSVINAISSDAQLFRDRAILSASVRNYGPSIVALIVKAVAETSTQGEDLAGALERITGQPRDDKNVNDYAAEISQWYEQVQERLIINDDATYPAPPSGPLLIVLPQCLQCGTVNQLNSQVCANCGAELKESAQQNNSAGLTR